MNLESINWRSRRSEVFCKKGVLRNFAKFTGKHLCFTGKHLCQSLFFNKVAGCVSLPKLNRNNKGEVYKRDISAYKGESIPERFY